MAGLWVVGLLVGRVSSQQYRSAEEASEIKNAVITGFVTDAIDLLTAVLAICFVLKLTAMQRARQAHEQMNSAHAPAS